jgi:hypothetical protein
MEMDSLPIARHDPYLENKLLVILTEFNKTIKSNSKLEPLLASIRYFPFDLICCSYIVDRTLEMKIFGSWGTQYSIILQYSKQDNLFLYHVIQRFIKRIVSKITNHYQSIQEALLLFAVAIDERIQMKTEKIITR